MSRDGNAAWRRLALIRRTPSVTLRWLIASTVGFFAFAYCFGRFRAMVRGRASEPLLVDVPATEALPYVLVASAVPLAAAVAAHEWIHGRFLARYGGRPRYGIATTYFGLPYAYAAVDEEREVEEGSVAREKGGVSNRGGTEPIGREHRGGNAATRERDGGADERFGGDADGRLAAAGEGSGTGDGREWGYARNEMLVVLLAPFVLVTVVGLVGLAVVPSSLLVFVLAANAAGSVADLWLAAILLGYPESARVGTLPDEDGFGIYAPRSRSRRRALVTTLLGTVATGAVATYAVLVVTFGGVVLHSLATGSGTVVVDLLGRPIFSHEVAPDRSAALLAVDAPAVAGLSAAGGCCWLALTAPRRLGDGFGP